MAPTRPSAKETEGQLVVMENKFMQVFVDLKRGVQSVYNKQTKQNISLQHELYYYDTAYDGMSAYVFKPVGPASPILTSPPELPECDFPPVFCCFFFFFFFYYVVVEFRQTRTNIGSAGRANSVSP